MAFLHKVLAYNKKKFRIYDYTQPDSMKSKSVECIPEDLKTVIKQTLSVRDHEGCSLEQVKKGSWLFKVRGKEYSITEYKGD